MVFLITWGVHAEPPVVERTVPAHGKIGVDPELNEIRIVFDQAMSPHSRSLVGGGESFPEIVESPFWESDREFVMPVQLKPDHTYWFSVNNPRFQGFRNVDGEPIEQYVIQFRTAPLRDDVLHVAEETSHDTILSTDEVDEVINELKTVIAQRYSHVSRLGIDWAEYIERNRETLRMSRTPNELTQNLAVMLAASYDKHMYLKYNGEQYSTYIRPMVPNANPGLIPRIVPNWKKLNDTVATGHWDDGISYIAIDTWLHGAREDIEEAIEVIDSFNESKAIILDVRLNGGGDETLAQNVASCFINEPAVYAKHVYRDAELPSGFTPVRNRVIEPREQGQRFEGRVAVLSGPVVMSSCEAFLLMMKQAPNATIIGASSQGSSGRQMPNDLGLGISIYLPTWRAMTPDEVEFEGIGIAPDIYVEAGAREFERGDPVLRQALIQLRRKQ